MSLTDRQARLLDFILRNMRGNHPDSVPLAEVPARFGERSIRVLCQQGMIDVQVTITNKGLGELRRWEKEQKK